MKFFALHLQKLVKLERGRGVRIEGDDFVLSPSELLPPPRVEGRLAGLEVRDTEIVQVFGPRSGAAAKPLSPPEADAPNYMYYRGGVLRFGKLTMTGADLDIVDADPDDPFDFYLDRYNDQLVAGYSRNTPDHGLIVWMPDYRRTAAILAKRGLGPRASSSSPPR
jgi:hypothetical protein